MRDAAAQVHRERFVRSRPLSAPSLPSAAYLQPSQLIGLYTSIIWPNISGCWRYSWFINRVIDSRPTNEYGLVTGVSSVIEPAAPAIVFTNQNFTNIGVGYQLPQTCSAIPLPIPPGNVIHIVNLCLHVFIYVIHPNSTNRDTFSE